MTFLVSTFDHAFLYETSSPTTPRQLPLLRSAVTKSAWSTTGALAVATEEGSVWVWPHSSNLEDAVEVVRPSSNDPVTGLLLDTSENLSVIYSQGNKVHILDVRTARRTSILEYFSSPITSISVSSDGLTIAVGHASGEVIVFNRQHGTHQILSNVPKLPIISLALHPSRKNILVIVQRSSSNLLIYDTLKASSVLRNVSLADGARVSSSGDATALAFHPTGSHFAVVGENEVLHIVNVATGSVRVRQLRKGPLTGVGWTSKTGLAIGTESGKLLIRDARDEHAGSDHTVDKMGETILSLTVQPPQSSRSKPPKTEPLGDATNQRSRSVSAASSNGNNDKTRLRPASEADSISRRPGAATSSRPLSAQSLNRAAPSVASNSSSFATPSNTTLASTSYVPSPLDQPTPVPVTRDRRVAADNAAVEAGKGKKVLFDQGLASIEGSPAALAALSNQTRPSSRASSSSDDQDRRRMKDKLEAQELLEQRELTEEEVFSGSRRFAGSPTTTTRSWTRRERNVPEGEDPNTPLMYAMSQQIKDLHLDMLRARRETKNETKALFRQYFCELEALRAENDRLRAENEELRRGQFF